MSPDDDLASLFIGEFTAGLKTARQALAANDMGKVEMYFHNMAGVGPSCGYGALGRLASIGEQLVRLLRSFEPSNAKEAARIVADALDLVSVLLSEVPDLPSGGRSDALSKQNLMQSSGPAPKILIVDDEPMSSRLLNKYLREAGYSTNVVADPNHSLEAIAQEMPDLIILDVVMPGLDGFELCRRIRAGLGMQMVPIIFVTGRNDTNEKVMGFQSGGDDYITKPFDPEELLARVASHIGRLTALRDIAIRDGLTQAYTQRFFKLRLEQELRRAERYDLPLSLAVLDVDHFKTINDTHGHLAGDAALCHLVQHLNAQTRSSDVVARYGGDEFAILLPHTVIENAVLVTTRICSRISTTDCIVDVPGVDRHTLKFTVSIGVTQSLQSDNSEVVIGRADRALYKAKSGGRNRVVGE